MHVLHFNLQRSTDLSFMDEVAAYRSKSKTTGEIRSKALAQFQLVCLHKFWLTSLYKFHLDSKKQQ